MSRGVLVSVSSDGQQGSLIDLVTRERNPVQLLQFEVEDMLTGSVDGSRLPPLLTLLRKVLQLSKQGMP